MKKESSKPVRIHIQSTVSDLCPEPGDENTENIIEYKTDGQLCDHGTSMSLTYVESREMGFDNTTTVFSFDKLTPSVVTMVRTGDASVACRFDPASSRWMCAYNTGVMPIEIAVNTRSVKNTLSAAGGKISLDYTIELRGINAERNRFMIEVLPS